MITCKKCGAELAEDFIFCNQCGTRINENTSEQSVVSTVSNLNVETAKEVMNQTVTKVSNLYIFDFAKRLVSPKNIPTVIYIVLNVLIMTMILTIPFNIPDTNMPLFAFLPLGLVVYGISLVVALSPIGEWVLRLQTGCTKITRKEQIDIIEPLFREVYEKAKLANPAISNNVRLYINPDDAPNAFATGRQTICVTEGLLSMPAGQIKATLAHEFGHLGNKDTDMILLITVGNLLLSGSISIVRFAINMILILMSLIFSFAASIAAGGLGSVVSSAFGFAMKIVNSAIDLLILIWSKIGTLLVMKSSRDYEYAADKFACSLSIEYGNDLCALLDHIGDEKPDGLFAALSSSHPEKNDRIARIQTYPGVTYRKNN